MKKSVLLAILSLVLAFLLLLTGLAARETLPEIKETILRLHIRANSDSKEDQELKTKIRDFIIESALLEEKSVKDKLGAARFIEENKADIEQKIDAEIARQGFSYKSSIEYKNEYFPTKEYEALKLPAGRYDALIVNLGAGTGENWFCIVFPPICSSSAVEKRDALDYLSESCDGEEMKLVTKTAAEKPEIKIKFKLIELLEAAKETVRKTEKTE